MFRLLFPSEATLVILGIKQLRLLGRSALLVQAVDGHRHHALTTGDLEPISRFNCTRWFDPLAIDMHLTPAYGGTCGRSGLEETRRPQPFVKTHTLDRSVHIFSIASLATTSSVSGTKLLSSTFI